MPTFFDAHLDLAYLAESGRDMSAENLATCGGRHLPAAVTFGSLRGGGVSACLGTIFTEAVADPSKAGAETGVFAYPLGDAEAAHRAGLRQLEWYHQWRLEGLIELMPRRGTGWPGPRGSGPDASGRVGILMECADPIRTPDELGFWVERGVIAIGLAWVHGSRYAAGNGAPADDNPGLTDLGRALVRAMDHQGVVHDLSHLSQRATDQVLELTDAAVIASHSNCRALFDRDPYPNARQRHLADSTIREVARRGGVVGINLLSDFLDPALERGQRASLDQVVRHIERVCEVAGHRRAVGLGSDMDGGFSAARLPAGVNSPTDLALLLAALKGAGWAEAEIGGFAAANWLRFWDSE